MQPTFELAIYDRSKRLADEIYVATNGFLISFHLIQQRRMISKFIKRTWIKKKFSASPSEIFVFLIKARVQCV